MKRLSILLFLSVVTGLFVASNCFSGTEVKPGVTFFPAKEFTDEYGNKVMVIDAEDRMLEEYQSLALVSFSFSVSLSRDREIAMPSSSVLLTYKRTSAVHPWAVQRQEQLNEGCADFGFAPYVKWGTYLVKVFALNKGEKSEELASFSYHAKPSRTVTMMFELR